MSDLLENVPPGSPIDDLVALQGLHPDIAKAAQAEVEKHVREAEAAFPAKGSGAQKKVFATDAARAVFERVADGLVDLASTIGLPMPVADALKRVVIPALPDLIDGTVDLLNRLGIFKKGA